MIVKRPLLTNMSGISISLKSNNKVKKKQSAKKKKGSLFGTDENDGKVKDHKITELEDSESQNDKVRAITPPEPLRSAVFPAKKPSNNQTENDPSTQIYLNSLPRHKMPEKTEEEEYEEVPVEGFGAALLRGMGWDPSEENDDDLKKPNLPHEKPRPELVGIGAKVTTSNNSLKDNNFMPIIKVKKNP